RGANVRAQDDSALRWAAGSGHTDTARLLLDRGANIHAQNDYALRCAAENGHTDTVRLLLDRGANIHARDDSALRCAAGSGHTDTARLLLDRGANIHARDDYALRLAAEEGHPDTIRLLIDYGANIHTRDWTGSNAPLHWATKNGHHYVVAMLELCYMRGFEEFRENPLAFINAQQMPAMCPLLLKGIIPILLKKRVPAGLMLLWSIVLNQEEAFNQLLNISMEAEEDTHEKTEVEESYDIANTIDKHHMTALMYAALFGNERMCAKL
ncbi:MAG: hypothetical protein US03_C0017G0001, partial [candidate division TM6 bacterium GW2011_GWF2_36_131]